MSDADMVKQARDFTERFGVENHAHWVPDGTSVVTIIAGLAQLLTETRTKALEEAAAVADLEFAAGMQFGWNCAEAGDDDKFRETLAQRRTPAIRSLKAEGGEK